MRIFAINLHRSADRRRALLEWLPACGLPWEIFEAVDTRAMRTDSVPWTNDHWGDPLWPGQVGCTMSHLRVLQRVLDYGLPWAVVLEDDVKPVTAPPCLANLALPPRFDVIYLHEMRFPDLASTVVEPGEVVHRVSPSMLTTGATIVSRSFAERFCAAFRRVELPIDQHYRKLSTEKDALFFELAQPLFQLDGSFPSTTGP